MYLSSNIRILRKKQRLTQEDLAGELGKTKATVSDYEKGKSLPPLDMLLKMCDIFRINLDVLVNKDLQLEPFTPEEKKQNEPLPSPGHELYNRLLILKLEEVALALKERDPEEYRRLRLDEVIGKGE